MVTLNRNSLIEGYIDNRYTLIPLNGKTPTIKDWVKTEYDPLAQACDLNGNYGVVLRSDDLVIDVDNAYTYNVDNVGKRTAENDFAKFSNSDEDDIGENAEKLIWDIQNIRYKRIG